MSGLKELFKKNYFRREEHIKLFSKLLDENHLVNGVIHHIRHVDKEKNVDFKFKPIDVVYFVMQTANQAHINCDIDVRNHPITYLQLDIYIDRSCDNMWFDYLLEGRTDKDSFRFKNSLRIELDSNITKRAVKEFLTKNIEDMADKYKEVI